MRELIGKSINRVLINEDDTVIAFDTNEGVIAYETYGDCCSSTWIESITGVEALIGQAVTGQESIDMPEPPSREYKSDHYVDVLQDYGEKLTTAKGIIDIVYRNSSNGYYGGSLDLLSSVPDVSGFKAVTDDWTAA